MSMKRIKERLSDPIYRTKLFVFILIGVVIVLLSQYMSPGKSQDFMASFFPMFVAVAIIQFLWDFLGGDPI